MITLHDVIAETRKKPQRVRVVQDPDPVDPREWDNLGTLVCWHRRYQLGDEQPDCTPDEYLKDVPKGSQVYPVYLYDHSGIALSLSKVGQFADPWDAGQLGVCIVTPARLTEIGTPADRVFEVLDAEINEYNQYLAGDVWGVIIEERDECEHCHRGEWQQIESCWGYFGLEDGNGMEDIVPDELMEQLAVAKANPEVG